MNQRLWVLVVLLLGSAVMVTSKDKSYSYRQMALGMRDAFDCGVVVEQYLHGRLKGNEDAYRKQRATYNCDYVESVLNTLPDQNTPPQ